MLSAGQLDHLIQSQHVTVLDGGLATELEARGCDLTHPLWSGKILQEKPTAIKDVHLAYYLAGADIAITASYQASTRGLVEHFGLSEQAAKDTIRLSVRLAHDARSEALQHEGLSERKLLIAGSVGPYGAYLADGSEYRGDYKISREELKAFHRPRIEALIDAGVDLLAIETIPSLEEIRALIDLLREEFPSSIAWITCTLRDAFHLADGTSLEDVAGVIREGQPQVVAFGVNCSPPTYVASFLVEMRKHTDIVLVCYPNSGEEYDAVSKTWRVGGSESDGLASSVEQWHRSGASLIGGCCRTTPADIRAMAEVAQRLRGS